MSSGISHPRARAFVHEHGTPIERARMHALLDHAPAREVPPELATLQNPDGGFPFEMQMGRPSTLNHSVLALRWLHDLGQADSNTAIGAYAFLLSRQTRRGIWRESVELLGMSLPLWMDPESAAGDIYTTALCAAALLGHAGAELACDRALAWLQTQQGRDGLLEGFKIPSSTLAVPLFAELLGQEARPTRRLIAGLGEALADAWTPSMIVELLDRLMTAGYGLRTRAVVHAWELLQAMQQPDGSFAADEGESAADVTLRALDLARRLGDQRRTG